MCRLVVAAGVRLGAPEWAAAIKHSSCSTHCMIAARLLGEGSAECCATAGLHKFVLV